MITKQICYKLAATINSILTQAESKIWHAHPVWFLDGNPIVGYSKLKDSVRLLFWSGQSFEKKSEKVVKRRARIYNHDTIIQKIVSFTASQIAIVSPHYLLKYQSHTFRQEGFQFQFA